MEKVKQIKGFSEKSQGIIHPKELAPYPFFKRFMTLTEAAFYTAQAESTIKRAVYDGDLPVIQRGDRSKWILDVYDLDVWMLSYKHRHRPVDTRMRAKDGKFK